MPNYQHNFNVAFENNSESVFEVQHLSKQNPFSGNLLNQAFAAPADYGMGEGYYFNLPTQNFVDEFETVNIAGTDYADPRLDYSIGREGAQLAMDRRHQSLIAATGQRRAISTKNNYNRFRKFRAIQRVMVT